MLGQDGDRARLWRRWFAAVTLGELAGFSVPATVGAVSVRWDPAVSVPALLAAGAVEGAVLGWSQAFALRPWLPALPRRRFAAATAAAAVAAYGLGLLPSTAGQALLDWPVWSLALGGTLAVTVLLASIGTAQWLVLRRVVAGTWWWVPWTAVAWLAGLAAFFAVTTPLWAPGQAVVLVVASGLLGGLVMAATVAAVTGLAALRLVERASGSPTHRAGWRRERAERP